MIQFIREILHQYRPVAPITWVCFSSLLMLAVFFKFSRFFSLRNLDLILLVLISPGMMLLQTAYVMEGERSKEAVQERAPPTTQPLSMIDMESDTEEVRLLVMKRSGYHWMLVGTFIWLTRMILDPTLNRRPLLTPNLSVGGMSFLAAAVFTFLMANVIFVGTTDAVDGARLDTLIPRHVGAGPGNVMLEQLHPIAEKVLVIVTHVVIIWGLILAGVHHFGGWTNGIGAALLYLMLPYTSQWTGRLDHFLPSAFLVWAVLLYRRPFFSGMLLGFAGCSIFYPFFLIPVWLAFYWDRGRWRMLVGVANSVIVTLIALVWAGSGEGYLNDVCRMLGILRPQTEGLSGIWDRRWDGFAEEYRLPVMATFIALAGSMTLWPAHKNLGAVLSCSTAIMLATQFWHGWDGGLHVGWYLPLLILVILRPNLEDRVAKNSVSSGWWWRGSRGTG
jgi:hypothetical protein